MAMRLRIRTREPPRRRAPGRSGRPGGRARLVGEKTGGQQFGEGGVGPPRPGRRRPDRLGEGGQSGRPLGDGPAGEERLEGVLDGGVVGCCGHLIPVIAGRAPRGTRTPEVFSGGRSRCRSRRVRSPRRWSAFTEPTDRPMTWRHLLHREVGQHPQEQHRALVVGQRRRTSGGRPRRRPACSASSSTSPPSSPVEVAGVVGDLRTAAAPSPVVDQPAVGDGEHPAAQGVLVPAEAGQAGEDAEEGLAGQVVGLGRAVQPEVAGHGGRQVAVEDLERPGGTRLRRGQDVVEGQSRSASPLLRVGSSSLSSSAGGAPTGRGAPPGRRRAGLRPSLRADLPGGPLGSGPTPCHRSRGGRSRSAGGRRL